jgi:DnaJ domain
VVAHVAGGNVTRSLVPVLLDFAAYPGRYASGRREPAELFQQITTVLQLACDRQVAALSLSDADQARAAAAARVFVAQALLRPGADHYAVLGLESDFDAERLREHYRLLMRLTHPDFAASSDRLWPADAATRINMAKDVLSSPVQRAAYDRLQSATANPPASPASAPRTSRPAAPGPSRAAPGVRPAARARYASLHLRRAVQRVLGLPGMGFFGTRSGTMTLMGLAGLLTAGTVWVSGAGEELRVASAPITHAAAPAEVTARHPAWAAPRAVLPAVVPEVVVASQAEQGQNDPKPVELTRADIPEAESPSRVSTPQPQLVLPRPAPQVVAPPPAPLLVTPRVLPRAVPGLEREVPLQAGRVPAPLASVAQPAPLEARVSAPAPALVASTRPVDADVAVAVRIDRGGDAVASLPSVVGGRITMADVQPALANVVSAMQSGRAEDVLVWVDRSSRRAEAGTQFVQAYNQALAGGRVLKVGKVQFRGRAFADQMVVDGVVQLHVSDDSPRGSVRDVHLRAFFVQRDSGPVLTDLRSGALP